MNNPDSLFPRDYGSRLHTTQGEQRPALTALTPSHPTTDPGEVYRLSELGTTEKETDPEA
ncbi:Protein of unknown function [Pyronema omphalodes CBS 100304]|uniref:Uncharacterized protein n=1 Tax=Pyronema omphalodes (strain CBS 100304) TaxID=1076935 RepID=U4LRB5_PYROM|nr:Protein of unknown function [Pyronema omphalodes CBS 100304]